MGIKCFPLLLRKSIGSSIRGKLLANLKGLSRKKYLLYFALLMLLTIILWAFNEDIATIISVAIIFFIIILGDILFDILGYFKNETEEAKEIPLTKRIIGYIIGTIIFGFIIGMLLRIFH